MRPISDGHLAEVSHLGFGATFSFRGARVFTIICLRTCAFVGRDRFRTWKRFSGDPNLRALSNDGMGAVATSWTRLYPGC